MKIYVASPDVAGQIDGTVTQNLLAHLPNRVGTAHEADVMLLCVSWFPSFKFQPPEKKRYVCLDFMEPHTPSGEYDKFRQWVIDNPPVLTLKRELPQWQVSDRLKPVEFPCYVEVPPTQSRAEFEARPLEVFYNWGYSNISRPCLHADIFRAMTTHGIEVIDSFDELEARKGDLPKRTWASIHTHHSMRRPIAEIMKWQQQAKISVSLPGNGWICFRSTEAPVGSIVAHLSNDMARSYAWIHSINCICLDPTNPFGNLDYANSVPDLYPVYVACQETIRRYEGPRYVREYVMPLIESAL